MTARCSEYRLRRRVHFYEVDSAGIVHFSWFFRYMEEAEHALWREAGLSIAAPGHEVGFPRVSATCDYHRPLRFEDEFDIVIRVAAITEKTIRYACEMTRDGTRMASGSIIVASVMKQADGSLKSVPLPPDIVTRFEVTAGEAEHR
jgi:YbgC/YbaW family acyl-CoA thioester hydrolase